MSVYRFKVYFEDDEAVMREIEIKSSQTFADFHTTIQKAIGFDNAHPASFFVSNDNWRKGKEIILLRSNHTKGLKGIWMHETKLADYIEDPHQKFIYEFDPEGGGWLLHAELLKIIPDASVTYPRINKSAGIAPSQYKITTPAITPAEEEEEAAEVKDDSEDTYVHPEAAIADHYHANGEEEEEIKLKVVSEEEVFEEVAEEEEREEEMGDGSSEEPEEL